MKDDFYNGFLVAPLNWGLGHASRCIPIIKHLIERDLRVVIASDGDALALLKQEFPSLTFEELPSYNVQYTSNKGFLQSILKQTPKFLKAIYEENKAIEEIVSKHNISKIISDNRYGCYHKDTKNVLITHQLSPNFIGVLKYLNWPIEQLLRLSFNNFDMVWVPDDESINLTGKLSSLAIADKKYIGILSRFMPIESMTSSYQNELLVILSGVEPQRTLLENKIIEQLKQLNIKSILVKGVGNNAKIEQMTEFITCYERLTSEDLLALIKLSRYIVCRSGYSSIMDLAILGKKAILIPTPGQIEQEYLAEKLMDEKKFLVQTQEKLNLKEAINEIENYTGIQISVEKINQFKLSIDKMID